MGGNFTNASCGWVNFAFTDVFLPTVYVIVLVFGLVANCFGLKSVLTNWTKLGSTNIFALNLCVADILYLLSLPFLVAYYSNSQKWIFGIVLCKITRFLFSINLYGSIGFLTCISVYRYLGIVHPLKVKGRIKKHYSIGITALVWVLVFIQSLPDVYFDKTNPGEKKCFDTTKNTSAEGYLIYSITRTVTGFAIPLVIMVCCYGHVAVTLATKKDCGDTMLKLRCLKLVVILAVLFSICFIPFHIFRNLNLQTRVWKMKHFCRSWYANIYIANQISNGMACLNSIINPLVYLFSSDEILMRCCRCVRIQSYPDFTKFTIVNSPRFRNASVKPPPTP
ncbi:P2Y purinoceptor 1 [Salminus brasiliensis]|uniref:P2Y purinoceptor 1 n=1 Tax=Salminus brasiliensis TaxID=930266 RepID=UPI003B835FCD